MTTDTNNIVNEYIFDTTNKNNIKFIGVKEELLEDIQPDILNTVLFKKGKMADKTIKDIIENNKSYFWFCVKNDRQIFNQKLRASGLFEYLKENKLLEPIFSFGKYKNKTYREIKNINPEYLNWLKKVNQDNLKIMHKKAAADLTDEDFRKIKNYDDVIFDIEYVLNLPDEKIENNYIKFYNSLFRVSQI